MCMLIIFLRFRQWADPGRKITENLWWFSTWTARGTALLEKIWSFLFNTSWAALEEEMTMVVVLPSFKDITGPYVLERDVSVLWGLLPKSRRFPMIGRGRGPGGGGLALLNFRLPETRGRIKR